MAMKENIEVRGGQRNAADDDKFATDAAVKAAATAAAAAATVVSTAEAIAGVENTKQMTALRMREGFNAAGSAPVFACRAWVNFNGTGTVAIRASGNVSSITDNGVGDYTVNFTTAMQDANYAISTSCSDDSNVPVANIKGTGADSLTTSCKILVNNGVGGALDRTVVCVMLFR